MMATRALNSPPRMLPLYARTVAPLLPGATLLPFLGARGGELPDLELTLAQLQVDPNHLAAYAHLCGFSLRDQLPATYPHVLAFPLHLALMADQSFPFPAVGLVHVANRIVQHRPLRLGEALDFRVSTTPLQAHPRGRTFALVSEVRVGDELVWEDHSTMLRRGGKGSSNQGAGGEEPVPEDARSESDGAGGDAGADADATRPEPPPRSAVWRLPGDLGRRYAAVSGDRNPIHMHALSAKAFGFPRAIAHGMWTQARCLAALEQRLPERFSVAVDFRKPILLPGEVAFGEAEDERGIRFAVTRNGKEDRETRHLDGRVEPRAGNTPRGIPAATHKEREVSP
jgi:acyl dehydratase